jgi:hypothetical protein
VSNRFQEAASSIRACILPKGRLLLIALCSESRLYPLSEQVKLHTLAALHSPPTDGRFTHDSTPAKALQVARAVSNRLAQPSTLEPSQLASHPPPPSDKTPPTLQIASAPELGCSQKLLNTPNSPSLTCPAHCIVHPNLVVVQHPKLRHPLLAHPTLVHCLRQTAPQQTQTALSKRDAEQLHHGCSSDPIP